MAGVTVPGRGPAPTWPLPSRTQRLPALAPRPRPGLSRLQQHLCSLHRSPCLPPVRTGPSVAGGNTHLSLRTSSPGDTGSKGAGQSPGIGPSVQPRGPAVLSSTGPGRLQVAGSRGSPAVLYHCFGPATGGRSGCPGGSRRARPMRQGENRPRGRPVTLCLHSWGSGSPRVTQPLPPPFSPGRRSTARWTRAPRPRAGRRPPTTTRSWACTMPKTTSLSERQVGAGCRGGGDPPHPGSSG